MAEVTELRKTHSLVTLPQELLLKILTLLPHQSLASLGSACKTLYPLSLSEELWQRIFVELAGLRHHPEMAKKNSPYAQYTELRDSFKTWKPSPSAPTFWKSLCAEEAHEIWFPPGRPPTIIPDGNKTIFKLALLSERNGVGKSAACLRFIYNRYVDDYESTLDEVYRRQICLGGQDVVLDVFDTCDREDWTQSNDSYIRTADCCLVCYSLENYSTLQEADQKLEYIARVKDVEVGTVAAVLCGLRCDLAMEDREVTRREAIQIARKYNVPWIETSAKEDHNIYRMLLIGAEQVILQDLHKKPDNPLPQPASIPKAKGRVKPCSIQ